MNQPDRSAFAYVILTVTAFFLACNHVIGRAVHEQIPPVGLSFWRWLAGALILLPFAWPGLRRHWPAYRLHWRSFALLGFLMVGSTTLVLIALTMTLAINVSLINAVQPTLTVLFAWLFLHEHLSKWRALGIVCGISGVVVMISHADVTLLAHLHLQPGDLVTLLAMCGFSGFALNLKRLPHEISAVEALFGITITGTAMLLPFYLWEAATVQAMPITATSIGAIVALALLVSVFGNLGWFAGNRLIGPSRASIFINLIPVFGSVLAITLLDEKLLGYHLAGGGLVVLGLILAAATGSKKTVIFTRRDRQPRP
jgi:drug/metabolite transporter (DMT)-like permease